MDYVHTHATLIDVCDCHMIREKKMDLHFLVVLLRKSRLRRDRLIWKKQKILYVTVFA